MYIVLVLQTMILFLLKNRFQIKCPFHLTYALLQISIFFSKIYKKFNEKSSFRYKLRTFPTNITTLSTKAIELK